MTKNIFLRVLAGITDVDDYFTQRPDCTGKLWISGLQKMTTALRILAYGDPSDKVDDPYRMAETTSVSLLRCCDSKIRTRIPTTADESRYRDAFGGERLPGMIGSIDCMHWFWDMCLTAYHGQFSGKGSKPSVVLEAIASYD